MSLRLFSLILDSLIRGSLLRKYYLLPLTPLLISSPDSTLINGLGRYSGDPTSSLAVVNVTEGQRLAIF